MSLIREIFLIFCSLAFAVVNAAENPDVFSIASGYQNGMYYMVSNGLGALLSDPPESLACEDGGNCGVKNLLLSNIASHGSLDNLEMLKKKTAQSAFIQSDIAYWAYSGTGLFTPRESNQNLRAIASLYPEMLHLVVKKESNIFQISDLRGKRVALGAKDSGTLVNALQLLKVNGLSEQDLHASYEDAATSAEDFLNDQIDAFFFVGGVPTPMISYLAKSAGIRLIPIIHDDKLYQNNHYYTQAEIPAGAYLGIKKAVPTVSVRALWLTRADVNEDRIYQLTKTLWQNPNNRPVWLSRLLPARALRLENALDGIGIPLHDGAKRFYDEIGKRF